MSFEDDFKSPLNLQIMTSNNVTNDADLVTPGNIQPPNDPRSSTRIKRHKLEHH